MEESIRFRHRNFVKYTNKNLAKHQEDGVVWCCQHESIKQDYQTIHGGIIADEMGCGKTLMSISLIMCNFVPKTLIVVPLPLLDNWFVSILNLTGHEPIVYHGNLSCVEKKLKQHHNPIVITTYGTISHKYDSCKDNNLLFSMKWDRIIYDEAHHMRNSSTKKHIAGLALKSNIKWLVTGTPINNKVCDLYNLCKIIGINNAQKVGVHKIKKNILKRKKTEVGIQLPGLFVHNYNVNWANDDEKFIAKMLHEKIAKKEYTYDCSQSEEKIYSSRDDNCMEEKEYGLDKNYNMNDSDSKNDCLNYVECIEHKSYQEKSQNMHKYINCIFGDHHLVYYLRCKQMCTYPNLLCKLESKDHLCEERNVVSNAIINTNKISKVVEIIKSRINNCNKKIVFCSFTKEVDIIKEQLQAGGITNIGIYDGRISQKERNNILNATPDVLILQIQMGCEGLNLQFANEIYFVSPIWNPAIESQAIARCYRLGQTKPTHVFKFNMSNFDETQHSMDNYMNIVVKNKKIVQDII